jgi:hypothetical protein
VGVPQPHRGSLVVAPTTPRSRTTSFPRKRESPSQTHGDTRLRRDDTAHLDRSLRHPAQLPPPPSLPLKEEEPIACGAPSRPPTGRTPPPTRRRPGGGTTASLGLSRRRTHHPTSPTTSFPRKRESPSQPNGNSRLRRNDTDTKNLCPPPQPRVQSLHRLQQSTVMTSDGCRDCRGAWVARLAHGC